MKIHELNVLQGGFSTVIDWSKAKSIRYHWRCWWNTSPGAGFYFNKKKYKLKPEHLVLVPPHIPIKHFLNNPVDSLALHITIDAPQPPQSQRIYQIKVNESLSLQLNKVRELQGYNRGSTHEQNNRHQFKFSLHCLANMVFQSLPDKTWSTTHLDSRVFECIQSFKKNFRNNHFNDTLARNANMSTSSFIRLFKNEYGQAPQSCLQKIRLDHCAMLLQQSDLAIESIAESSGFCDRNYMSKQFKKRFGVGPASYRKQGSTNK